MITSVGHDGGRKRATAWQRGVACAMLALGFLTAMAPAASAETRTLKLYFVHTGERAEITFKRDGRYDQGGLSKINRFLRDWRRNEPTKMDPRLLDVVWEAYKQSGSRDYIHVVSAYRSPATNSMLRSRSNGVAKKSQHMLGKAMDFYLPDVKLKNLRYIGLKLQAGGVGYYPRSGSPFVHLDVGSVRHWPKMSRSELASVFPSGKTLHVPSDGKPLPGYDQAVAAYKSRQSSGALAIASATGSSKSSGGRNFLSAFFGGGGADEEEESGGGEVEVAAVAPAPKAAVKATKLPDAGIKLVAPDQVDRVEPGEAAKEAIVAALPTRDVPLPGVAPRPLVDVGAPANALVPLGAAPSVEAAPVVQEVALNIPLPTRRPAHATPAELAAPVALVAMANASEETAGVPLPVVRPMAISAQEAIRAVASASVEPKGDMVAAISRTAAVPAASPVAGAFNVAADEVIATDAKIASLAYAATGTPRSTLIAGKDGDALASVRTTAKAARAKPNDAKPDPRALVVAAAPSEARWAIDLDPVAKAKRVSKAPTFSYNAAVAVTPTEVLTGGFTREVPVADASRFAGKAVSFMPMAKFQTN